MKRVNASVSKEARLARITASTDDKSLIDPASPGFRVKTCNGLITPFTKSLTGNRGSDRWMTSVSNARTIGFLGSPVLPTKEESILSMQGAVPVVTLRGIVEKILPALGPTDSEKVQILIDGADDLYREIRFNNTKQDGNGQEVILRQGAKVKVTIEILND